MRVLLETPAAAAAAGGGLADPAAGIDPDPASGSSRQLATN
jgi:hypothetical protein